MPQGIKLWKIKGDDNLREVNQSKLNVEERIEKWIEQDISIISNDLLIIGRQVATDFSGAIDILCLDYNGDIVILELKRDKTPREVTAQILEYASWVKDLSNEKITEIANSYFEKKGQGTLEEQFQSRFDVDLPDILNEHHKMLIVGSEIDSRSERIINYLSDEYGVSINAATFQYFSDDEVEELIGRVFLIEPTQVDYKTKTLTVSKRRNYLTLQELQETAKNKGVEELFSQFVAGLKVRDVFDKQSTTLSTVSYMGVQNGNQKTILHISPIESDSSIGLQFQIYIERFMEHLHVEKNDILSLLPSTYKEAVFMGLLRITGYFKNSEEIDKFLKGLEVLRKHIRE